MIGSEKQVRWAEHILADARNTIQANLRLAEKNYEKYHDVFFEDRIDALNFISAQFEAAVANMTAGMIIDMRARISPSRICDLIERIEDEIRREKGRQ